MYVKKITLKELKFVSKIKLTNAHTQKTSKHATHQVRFVLLDKY